MTTLIDYRALEELTHYWLSKSPRVDDSRTESARNQRRVERDRCDDNFLRAR